MNCLTQTPKTGTSSPKSEASGALVVAVQTALQQTGRGWLQRLTVTVLNDADVVLTGIVPNFYLKQLAQVTVLAVPGIASLRNEVRVAERTK